MNDLISRRAAIKAIDDLPNCYNGYSDTYDKAYIIGVLEELPTIDPGRDIKHAESISLISAEPKHGKWKPFDLTWGRSVYACTSCGEAFEVPTEMGKPIYGYCPNCGARMSDECAD